MAEPIADKRARMLSAGPRRKRPTREAEAQQRAYKKAERGPRLEGDAKIIAEKCRDITKLEETIKLVDELKRDRNKPIYEARDRVRHAEAELTVAKDYLRQMEMVGECDNTDLDKRQLSMRRSIEVFKGEIEALMKKAIDASQSETA